MVDVKHRKRRVSTQTFEKTMIARLDQEGSVRLALQGMVELMDQHTSSCGTCGSCTELSNLLHRMKQGLKIER